MQARVKKKENKTKEKKKKNTKENQEGHHTMRITHVGYRYKYMAGVIFHRWAFASGYREPPASAT